MLGMCSCFSTEDLWVGCIKHSIVLIFLHTHYYVGIRMHQGKQVHYGKYVLCVFQGSFGPSFRLAFHEERNCEIG